MTDRTHITGFPNAPIPVNPRPNISHEYHDRDDELYEDATLWDDDLGYPFASHQQDHRLMFVREPHIEKAVLRKKRRMRNKQRAEYMKKVGKGFESMDSPDPPAANAPSAPDAPVEE